MRKTFKLKTTMIQLEQIQQIIYNAIDEVNEQLSSEKQLVKSLETVLFGKSSKLDSLSFINLVVAIETELEEEFDILITIANEEAMTLDFNPYKSVQILSEYILKLIKEESFDE